VSKPQRCGRQASGDRHQEKQEKISKRRPGEYPAFFVAQLLSDHVKYLSGAMKGINGAKQFHSEPEKEGRRYGR
jgi:hypothetical protein